MANTSLITLQTDLKSLRYGSDKPYVTKDIGQAPGSQIGQDIARRIDDTSRIAQMLVGKPGLKYLLREAQLQQIGVEDRIQKARKKGKSIAGAVLGELGNTAVGTVKIVGSTLAQVPVNGTGTHFLKGFRTDTYLRPGANEKTPRAFAAFFGAGGVEGAQYALRGETVPNNIKSEFYDPELDYTAASPEVKPIESLNLSKTTNKYLPKATTTEAVDSLILDAFLGTEIDPLNSTYLEQQKQLTTVPETTATPNTNTAQNLVKSIPHTGSINADINPDSINNVSSASYSYENTFTGTSTDTAITNAQNNSPIRVAAPGTGQRETTATSGSSLVTGTANTGYTGENTSNPADELGLTVPTGSRYTKEESYGTNVSDYSTGVAPFITQNAQFYNPEDDTVNLDTLPIHQIDLVTRENIGNVIVGSVIPRDKYNSEGKYYEQQKSRTINGTAKNVIKETRVNLGDQGVYKGRAYYADYSNVDGRGVDKLNALDIQNSRPDGVDAARDLAKFFFEIITPEGSKFLNFRAFITSMDDSYNANWEAKKYVGRADDFYTYGGFSRDINVGFKIAAATRSEMKPLYKKMVYLASTTAPTYGDFKFMRGTVVRLSLGSYFNEIPGVITSVKYSWTTDYPWEIAMESPEGGESGVQELPMVMDCSITFKPIHDFVPQTGLQHYFTSKESNKTFF